MVSLRPRKAKKEEPKKEKPVKKKAAAKPSKKTSSTKKDTPQKKTTEKTASSNNKMAQMKIAKIYPLYVNKIKKKGRTEKELNEVVSWLTSYAAEDLKTKTTDSDLTMEAFFEGATINDNANKITGTICGHKIEDIEDPLTKNMRYMDKLVDELAKGKSMEEICRS